MTTRRSNSVTTLAFVTGGLAFPLALLYQTWSSPLIFGCASSSPVKTVGIDQRTVGYALSVGYSDLASSAIQ